MKWVGVLPPGQLSALGHAMHWLTQPLQRESWQCLTNFHPRHFPDTSIQDKHFLGTKSHVKGGREKQAPQLICILDNIIAWWIGQPMACSPCFPSTHQTQFYSQHWNCMKYQLKQVKTSPCLIFSPAFSQLCLFNLHPLQDRRIIIHLVPHRLDRTSRFPHCKSQ